MDFPSSEHVLKALMNRKSIFVEYERSIRSGTVSTRRNPVSAGDSGKTSYRAFEGINKPETKRSTLGRRQPAGKGIDGIPRVDKMIRQGVEVSER